jgi:homoserine kinase type II
LKVRGRQQFDAEELAIVLSHYDIGVIESVTRFDRGSRRSPKVGIVAAGGKYLLKRRAKQRRSVRRVELAHAVQRRLTECGYPAPRLVATRDTGETCLRLAEETYELFEYVSGHGFSRSREQTQDAGRKLGMFHKLLRGFGVPPDAPVGSFHDVNGVRTALHAIPQNLSSHDSVVGMEAELPELTRRLFDAYDRAADAVNQRGFASLPVQVIHGDWHPGNMLFKRDSIVAVIDYDSCRVCQRVVDAANGALQFSLTSGGDPKDWPNEPDAARLESFVEGYSECITLSDEEWRVLPHLMIEALIGESVFPIAQTGFFGKWAGFGFLSMIDRKVRWLADHVEGLIARKTP